MKRRKGFYSISVVAKMFSVHQQTIRMYEKEGLIAPKRSAGNTRLFSEDDVDRLEEIINLTHKMGVNLAGVEIILRLQKKIKRLQDDMNKLFEKTHGQLDEETDQYRGEMKKQVRRLAQIKQENMLEHKKRAHDVTAPVQTDIVESEDSGSVDDWEIDYDED